MTPPNLWNELKLPKHQWAPPIEPGNPLSYLASILWRLLCVISIFKPLEEHRNSKHSLILAMTAIFLTQPLNTTWNSSQLAANCLCVFALSHSLMYTSFRISVIIVYEITTGEWTSEHLHRQWPTYSLRLSAFFVARMSTWRAWATLTARIAVATVTLTPHLLVLWISAAALYFGSFASCYLPIFWRHGFWTDHLLNYINGFITPFKWRHPTNVGGKVSPLVIGNTPQCSLIRMLGLHRNNGSHFVL
ncbi:hypothetical protein V8B97DRAFT_985866 [Scleroderma yunnanense]